MTQYTLQEKVQFTEHIVNEVNKFWIKHKGELFNHKDFWDETYIVSPMRIGLLC